MRITFLNPTGVVGGGERAMLASLREACEYLPNTPRVILLADGPLRTEVERLGAAVVIVPLPADLARLGDSQLRSAGRGRTRALAGLGGTALASTPAAVRFFVRLRAAIRRGDPQLIHSHGLKAHVLAALARPRGVPVLWHLQDFPGHRPIITRALRLVAGRASGCIACSDAVRRDAAATLPNLPVWLALNPTDTTHFCPASRDGADLDRLADLTDPPANTIRMGLVATYAHWKGQDVFLDALARLVAGGASVRGFIVGGPIYATAGSQFTEAELRGRADALGLGDRVGFVPFQSDPADVYRMLDVVVHASTRPEPFGLAITEAMACGRPVVVASAGGAAELFTPGFDGVGHTPGDPAALAQVLAPLLTDPGLRARLGANARQTAVASYSQERFGRELAAIYARFAKAEV